MILTVGDSICWGQGIAEDHKFDTFVARAKSVDYTRLAHSGAVIGTKADASNEAEVGEIPVAFPSVWQQVQSETRWEQISLVVLNGGLNDVGLTRILNPVTKPNQLAGWVNQFCNLAMRELLVAAAGRLKVAKAQIAVIPYYPILSHASGTSEPQFRTLLEIHGVATSSLVADDQFSLEALIPAVIANCMAFWNSSNEALAAAVAGANQQLGRNACVLIPISFAEDNAMWAPESLLWELDGLLNAEDEVRDTRAHTCELLYGDVVHLPQWVQCDRASAGHPNVQGASRIANAILGAVGAVFK